MAEENGWHEVSAKDMPRDWRLEVDKARELRMEALRNGKKLLMVVEDKDFRGGDPNEIMSYRFPRALFEFAHRAVIRLKDGKQIIAKDRVHPKGHVL